MESQERKKLYTPEWFRERAFGSLKKIGDHTWDYSDSLLLYTPGTESEYESIQQDEDPYSELITKPERKYLEGIAKNVVEQLPPEFEYVDLGPGTAHKEQFIFDAAKQANKKFIYRPVDISEQYLTQATNYASGQHVEVSPIQSSFEELPEKLSNVIASRLVSLGLTFTNYEPQAIMSLLTSISGKEGYIFIDVQIRDRVDMEKIVSTYAKDARALIDPKLKLLGLDPIEDISDHKTDEGVQIWETLKSSNSALEASGVVAGDKLLIFQSLRYTKESFEEVLKASGLSYTLFDTNESFIGALLKTS